MTVYEVFYCYYYEGARPESSRIFNTKEKAIEFVRDKGYLQSGYNTWHFYKEFTSLYFPEKDEDTETYNSWAFGNEKLMHLCDPEDMGYYSKFITEHKEQERFTPDYYQIIEFEVE